MNMTDKEFVAQVERYYCKQQRSKWQAFLVGCVLFALTLFAHDWLSQISHTLPTICALISGFYFTMFLINYWGSPADRLLADAVEVLAKYRKFKR